MSDAALAAADTNRLAVASQWQLMWWAFRRHRAAMIGLWITILFYIIAIIPGFFAINDPSRQNARAVYHPPQPIHFVDTKPDGGWSIWPYVHPTTLKRDPQTLASIFTEDTSRKNYVRFFGEGYEYSFFGLFTLNRHLIAFENMREPIFFLGADRLGRCVWSRMMQGAQISLSVGLVGVILSLVLGVLLGGVSGYFGGRIDFVIQRVIEFVLSLPNIPIWLALSAALPQNWPATLNYFMITVILSLTGWAQLARVVRGRFLSLRTEEFVTRAASSSATCCPVSRATSSHR